MELPSCTKDDLGCRLTMAKSIHITYFRPNFVDSTYIRKASLCHLSARNILITLEEFRRVYEIVPDVCCTFCVKHMNRLLTSKEELEEFYTEQGLYRLSSLNKT